MPIEALAAKVLSVLANREQKLAFAESLTGGRLADTFISIPGASAVISGAVVAYATETKHSVLAVDSTQLADFGPVSAPVAAQMAIGVAKLFSADWAIATTGVAGPDPQGQAPVGKVFISLYSATGAITREFLFSGNREEIRDLTVRSAVELIAELLEL